MVGQTMALYILQNNQEEWLNKAMEWVYGCRAEELFATPHKDIALNQLIELNTRDIDLRARIVACDSDDKGRPRLPQITSESVA